MIPTPSAVQQLMKSPAVREAPPVVQDWLAGILLNGEKASIQEASIRREKASIRREEAPVREAPDPGR
jgi:hypothetical protein